MFQKHTLELLTEGKFGTVSVFFEYAPENQVSATRDSEQYQESNRRHYTNSAPRAVDAPPPWTSAQAPAFPFLNNAVPKQVYTYKVTPELHAQLEKGDSLVVPNADRNSPQKFAVATVWMVHPTPQIDYDAPFEYKWVVQKIDADLYVEQVAQEENFRTMLLEVQKAQQRDAIRQSVLTAVAPGGEAYQLFSKALTSVGIQVPSTEAPAVPPVPAATASKTK